MIFFPVKCEGRLRNGNRRLLRHSAVCIKRQRDKGECPLRIRHRLQDLGFHEDPKILRRQDILQPRYLRDLGNLFPVDSEAVLDLLSLH